MEINKPTSRPTRTPDPLIDEVRSIRSRISAEDGHDMARHCERLREIESQMKDRLVQPPARPGDPRKK